ncbi:MAG: response regulator [Ktedonobacterales bacterium]
MYPQPDLRMPPIIRVLIVDDVPETVQIVQKLLLFERDIRVVGAASGGREAIAKAGELRPDVILMDINLNDMDGLTASGIISRQMATCIVIMSVQADPEYFSQAMTVGVRGYLVKPFSGDALTSTIRRSYAEHIAQLAARGQGSPNGYYPQPPQPPRAPATLRRLITVYSPKGGVGTSVIAANLAIALRQQTKKSVALVDANLQSGDAHILLNINTTTTIDDLRENPSLDEETIASALAPHEASGIGVLRAPFTPESAEFFTSDAMQAILVELRDHYDYVVIDTSSEFSVATLSALELADLALVVTTLEVTTIHHVNQFFQVVERIGIPQSKMRLICNRVDNLYGVRPAEVEAQLGHRFFAQAPEDVKTVATSVNRGVPFLLAQKNAGVSRAINTLAQRLISEFDLPATAAAQSQNRSRRALL